METKKISFSRSYKLTSTTVKPLKGYVGLYLIYSDELSIPYPFKESSLIYIGKSDSKQSSIGKRLMDHLSGLGNPAVHNYAQTNPTSFTYLNFELFRSFWKSSIEDLENYFINDFFRNFGCYPVCNNKSSLENQKQLLSEVRLEIDWGFFTLQSNSSPTTR